MDTVAVYDFGQKGRHGEKGQIKNLKSHLKKIYYYFVEYTKTNKRKTKSNAKSTKSNIKIIISK